MSAFQNCIYDIPAKPPREFAVDINIKERRALVFDEINVSKRRRWSKFSEGSTSNHIPTLQSSLAKDAASGRAVSSYFDASCSSAPSLFNLMAQEPPGQRRRLGERCRSGNAHRRHPSTAIRAGRCSAAPLLHSIAARRRADAAVADSMGAAHGRGLRA